MDRQQQADRRTTRANIEAIRQCVSAPAAQRWGMTQ